MVSFNEKLESVFTDIYNELKSEMVNEIEQLKEKYEELKSNEIEKIKNKYDKLME